MLFSGKSIKEISEADLLGLIGTSKEDQAVDFKKSAYQQPPDSELPTNQGERNKVKNRWKVDLCTDLSAFANANGGWIICGMKEEGGTATELCGIGASINTEHEIQRLEQCAMRGIEPPLPRIEFRPIDLQDGEKAIVIHVPRSFRAPHRVHETSRFHIRRSGRNDEMNMDELRAAFNLSESLVNRVKSFRKERVEALSERKQEEIPVLLADGPAIVLHTVPMTFSDPTGYIDLSAFHSRNYPMWVFEKALHNGQFNLDGYVRPNGRIDSTIPLSGYVQMYRTGIVESVSLLHAPEASIDLDDPKTSY